MPLKKFVGNAQLKRARGNTSAVFDIGTHTVLKRRFFDDIKIIPRKRETAFGEYMQQTLMKELLKMHFS